MACNFTVRLDAQPRPYSARRPGVPGGRLSGTARITAQCADERQGAELVNGEVQGWFDRFLSALSGRDILNTRVPHLDATLDEIGFAVILKIWRIDASTLDYEFDLSTSVNGAQSFLLKVACRCRPSDPFTNHTVSVPFTMP